MSLAIYQLEHSPYCIPITRALDALGVPFEARNIANPDRSEIIRLTNGAYYQVPLLVHDGTAIYESGGDSLDIARYVDRTFASGRLFPAEFEGLQRVIVPHIEGEIEGTTFKLIDPFYMRSIEDLVDRTLTRRHKERKFGAGCLDRWERERPALLVEAERLLAPFDLMLEQNPFLLGQRPVYADFALFGILGNMTYKGHNSLPSSLKCLAEWYGRMQIYRFAE